MSNEPLSSDPQYKRFCVFVWPDYYPGGGFNDCVGSFDTKEDADIAFPHADEIFDCETRTRVKW